MLQWFLRFSEFTEFNDGSAPFRENSIANFVQYRSDMANSNTVNPKFHLIQTFC